MNQFYITTPIYYVNDKPHVGTAYSTVIADIINRYLQYFGNSSYFLTGLDEHGQKCQQVALSKKISPQSHCDQMAGIFKKCWQELNIQYDQFYRTSDSLHKKRVQEALKKLFDKGYIYESTYEGWYCVSEEIFYKEKDLIEGKSPQKNEVTRIKEKNYFFKMSLFQKQLIDHLNKNPDFIFPQARQNEVLSFLKKDLEDLCVSRPKSRLTWGVELPFDPQYVSYVWVDALLNYLFAIEKEEKSYWNEAHHLIGKDILITHCVYWPCLLMALDIPLPKKVLSHGWLLNKEFEKMSKSKGDTLDPLNIIKEIGTDALRYYFIKGVRFGNDAPISLSLIKKEYNNDLAHNLGNILQRTSALVQKYFDGKIPPSPKNTHPLQEKAVQACENVKTHILNFSLHQACMDITELFTLTNQFLEKQEPWKQVKTDIEKAGHTLYIALEMVRVSTSLLQPIVPQSSQEILNRLGLPSQDFEDSKKINVLKTGSSLKIGTPLFPRIDL